MRGTKMLIGGTMLGVLLAACGGSHSSKAPNTAASASGGSKKGGASCKAASAAQPLNKNAPSSTVALAKVSGKRVAYVADEDAKAVLTFDLDAKELVQIAETKVDGTPGSIYIAADGRVFVTLRDKNELAVLSAAQKAEAPLTQLCSTGTPNEPVAISATPDESTIIVTTGWGQKLIALDSATLAPKFEAKLPREPRSVVVGDDGKTAFISHAVGSIMSTVDLASAKHEAKSIPMRGFDAGTLKGIKRQREMFDQMKKNGGAGVSPVAFKDFEAQTKKLEEGRASCQGFALAKSTAVAGRIFAPQVMVDPGDFDQRPDGYGNEHAATEVPSVAVIDEAAAAPIVSSVTIGRDPGLIRRSKLTEARDTHPECLLPRAATIDAKSKSVLVTCFGIDAVVAYDATSANPFAAERRRWTVGSGPNGIAVDPEQHKGVVWSQFDRTLSTFTIDVDLVDEKGVSPNALRVTKASATPLKEKLPAEYALGRILFHAAGDARIAADGRACASCHPDGRDDAITWATPEGPRRSIMLAGRASKTPPYSWNGSETTLHNHLGNTFDRLSGKGLRSIELDALVTYVTQMPAPNVTVPTDGADKTKVERGKAVFMSAETGCATCHSGATFTDGKNHDVSSKHKADRSAQFNTPSLHLISGSGPYFHDGRYTSLGELLTKSDGQMGKTKHLSNSDLDALESYLKTL